MLCSVRARKRFIAASGLAERCFLEQTSSSISGFSFTSEGNVEDLSDPHPNPGLESGGKKKDTLDTSGWMSVVHSESGSPLQEGWGAWTSVGRRQDTPELTEHITDLAAAAGARCWKTLMGNRTTGSLLPLSGRKWMVGIRLMSELAMSWSSSPPTPPPKRKKIP